ncbi:unnamed protein product [Spirodela intermedia]|uniref:Uncharacterized protein n=1 Tax=Spirodela intermedia TaxID=51605 RepID=A0A7I8I948_SPIIN|nr:unnamed protein product [Spirodela intermedia]CAA6654207.1 unnamed protein product [Spirodela intermedia]
MDFLSFAVNFLVDEMSADSEATAPVAGPATAAAAAAFGRDMDGPIVVVVDDDDDDDDLESVIGTGGEVHEDDAGDGEAWRWEAAAEEEEERGEREEEEGDGGVAVPDCRRYSQQEEDRRFWESCLASGYP